MPNHQQVQLQGKQNQWEYVELSAGPFAVSHQGPYDLAKYKKQAEWSTIQNSKYAAFIQKNFDKMNGRQLKNLWSLFIQMSKIIKTRNYRQCKSHHQKMLQEFGSIKEIVSFLVKSNSKFLSLMEKEIEKIQNPELASLKQMPSLQQSEIKHEAKTGILYRNQSGEVSVRQEFEKIQFAEIFALKLRNLTLPKLSA